MAAICPIFYSVTIHVIFGYFSIKADNSGLLNPSSTTITYFKGYVFLSKKELNVMSSRSYLPELPKIAVTPLIYLILFNLLYLFL